MTTAILQHSLKLFVGAPPFLVVVLKELKKELKLVQLSSKSLFAVSQIGSKANAIMKAHNEKLASMLLEENPESRLKPAHS